MNIEDVMLLTRTRLENQAWAYGNSYCSQRIKLTSGKNICVGNRQYNLKNIPLVDKTGAEQPNGARPDMTFSFNDCEINNGALDLEKVTMTTTIEGSTAAWGCTAARENRACVLNGETGSESAVTVYLRVSSHSA